MSSPLITSLPAARRAGLPVSRVSPAALHSRSGQQLPEDGPQDLEIPTVPSTAISGNSNILLCSSAEVSLCDLEPSLDIKDELLDRISTETSRSVPDIDLTGSLGITDWETLYKSVANDLEPLSTPVVNHMHTHLQQLPVRIYLLLPRAGLPVRGTGRLQGWRDQSRN